MYHFLDTSAILNGALKQFKEDIYISPLTLTELENIKTSSNKDEHIKYLAREAIREILLSKDIEYSIISQKQVEKLLKKYDFLSNINDHRLLCEASLLAEQTREKIEFITSDGALFLFAEQMPNIEAVFLLEEKPVEEQEFCGWGKYFPNNEQLAMIYSDPKINTLGCKINEFAEIFVEGALKDVLFWDGKEYRILHYKEVKNSYLNTTIKPRNLEQKMAFDLLQNRNIPVKLLYGVPGSGKDYLMLTHALDLIQRGEMNKIVFIRNLVPFKDAPEIGFLAGSLQEKIEWGLGPIMSILGEEGLKNAQDYGTIEAVNLGFIRGCSWDDTIIYVSEGQNITGGGYKLLISRCGKNSELWINGDILQTDDKKFENNNGIKRLLSSLSDNKLFGAVKMLKTERSEVANLASII